MGIFTPKRVYNLQRQAPDTRDYSINIVLNKFAGAAVPPAFDLSEYEPEIYTQKIGDCTANVGVAAKFMLDNTPLPSTTYQPDIIQQVDHI